MKNFLLSFIVLACLASCVSVELDPNSVTAIQPGFVTSTLPPTKQSFVPPTLTQTPEATVAPTLAVTAPANCKDGAVLLRDVTIPDDTQMKPGEKFTKTWELQNTGTCPWINYKLVFAAGDQMGAPLSAPVPDTASKQKVQVSVELTAPTSDGKYAGYFTLHNSSDKIIPIGAEQTFWVKIVVGNSTAVPTTASGASPTQASNTTASGSKANCNYSENAGYVSQIVSLINSERSKAGLGTLTVNSQLTAAAQGHSADMACNNFLSHTGSNGSYINDRLSSAGYSLNNGFSEIIAIGTPQDAMSQWQADQPHWDVVLNGGSTEIGVGYAYSSTSDYGGYITVDFGSQ
jgi:uncharacterized protein YkwD